MKHGWKVFLEHYSSKEHWYIKCITWCIISIVCLAILVQILKEIGFLPAQKIFDFLNQWAMVLSAAATLLLASTAFWAIMDNRYGRIVDRRERLLNEIIEWAIEVSSEELELNPRIVRARGHYSSKICLASWSQLQKAIGDVMKKLDQYIDSHRDTAEDIRELAINVIDEAVKIKTVDLG